MMTMRASLRQLVAWTRKPAPQPCRRPSTRLERSQLARGVESLEQRNLLAADISFDPSPLEQEMLEHVNRMRIDPQAELGVLFLSTDPSSPNFLVSSDADLNAAMDFFEVDKQLLLDQWSTLQAVPPLAWSDGLQQGATTHNQRMILQDMQSHNLPADEGLSLAAEPNLATRLADAGYDWNGSFALAENIYAFATSVQYGHAGFVVDWGFTPTGIQSPPGHRNNIMNGAYKEIGISVILEEEMTTAVGEYVVTQDFGLRDTYGNPRVLGVVYTDDSGNGIYNAGEGEAGVTIEFRQGDSTFTTTTMSAGGYQIQLAPGTYTVTASGGALGGTFDMGTIVVAAENIKLDLETDSASTSGTVSGIVWLDANQNGQRDASEAGLAGTTVFLDADNDGVLDTGELSMNSGLGGSYRFNNVPAGNYHVRLVAESTYRTTGPASGAYSVNVTDGGSISGRNFGKFQFVVVQGNTADIHGTGSADTMTWTAGTSNHTINVNGDSVTLNATTVTNITFHGKGGTDTLNWNAGSANDTAVVRTGTALLTSPAYSLTGKSFEVVYIDGGGGTNARANLYDSPGDDFFIGKTEFTRLYGPGFWFEVSDFQKNYGYATSGGNDRANLFDGTSNDLFYGQAHYSLFRSSGNAFYNYAQGFEKVYAYAEAGGNDQAFLYDAATDDLFYGLETYAILRGPGTEFYNYATGFDTVQAYANNGGRDVANLYDSTADDRLYAFPDHAYLRGPNSEFWNQANSFEVVSAYAYNGGDDFAYLYDAASDDLFLGYHDWSLLRGPNSEYYNETYSFDRVFAHATAGGVDYAYLYDTAGDDRFFGLSDYSVMRGANFEYYNSVAGFDRVHGTGGNGGNDIAYFYDSAGDDRFYGLRDYSIMRGLNYEYYNYVTGFATVRAVASNGGANDMAYLYDSPADDHVQGLGDYAQLTSTGRDHKASGFDRVHLYLRDGGHDTLDVGVVDYVFKEFGG